jgi:negative regulator of flagellin synthesis FlgM
MDIHNLTASQLRDRAIAHANQRPASSGSLNSEQSERSVVSVELSSVAQTLQSIAGDSRPAFDQARVEAIRDAISQGRYHIDPQRLALNFTRIESEIFQ